MMYAGAFATRAKKLAALLGTKDGVSVSVNPEKPRKTVFAVRVGSQEVFATGPEPRPFKALKAMDVEEVAELVSSAL